MEKGCTDPEQQRVRDMIALGPNTGFVMKHLTARYAL